MQDHIKNAIHAEDMGDKSTDDDIILGVLSIIANLYRHDFIFFLIFINLVYVV